MEQKKIIIISAVILLLLIAIVGVSMTLLKKAPSNQIAPPQTQTPDQSQVTSTTELDTYTQDPVEDIDLGSPI